ncbi:class I SAM-dependent methyltransferase [Actinokineospora enzanensis]|uniref:class I SAM-dependent methyltransferase n=1 Tax=Actinokineospora enzanensis TaxID=155975 RepID=UPI001469B651|nr:class I SAM-dependent methyltransferase [Actinokineospora enzanensis]
MNYHSQAHWDGVHSVESPTGGAAAAAVLDSVVRVLSPLPRDATVVDVACGDGALLRALPGPLIRIGLDLAPTALHKAWTTTPTTFLQADAARLPLGANTTDAVTLLSSWWALPTPERMVVEAARVLRPGGRLLIHTWDAPTTCRMITLGAATLARVIPSLIRPADHRGPFDDSTEEITTATTRAGLTTPTRHPFSWSWPIASTDAYLTELANLAPTAYATYATAPDRTRVTAQRLLTALLARLVDEGTGTLGLTWHLSIATKPS